MNKLLLIGCLLALIPLGSRAQTKKSQDLFPGFPNANTWQADESLVKAGKGYFLNKMVLKTNADAPEDMYALSPDELKQKNLHLNIFQAAQAVEIIKDEEPAGNTLAGTK